MPEFYLPEYILKGKKNPSVSGRILLDFEICLRKNTQCEIITCNFIYSNHKRCRAQVVAFCI